MRGMHGVALARAFAGVLALASLALPARGAATDPAGAGDTKPNRVDYVIDARVDTATMKLTGTERVHFENNTDAPTSELWFHLYWNAFANNRSTHLVSSRGELRGNSVEDGWGWQQVLSLRVGGEELLASLTYEHPDDGNADDRTVLRVPLAHPVEPGRALDIEIDWEAQIPRLRRRTGFKGDFLFIAQWFPKLGVFEGARGWNCHQFHASTEFFSDYGTYQVTLDLPAEYANKVGSSGVIEKVEPRGARVITHCVAPSLDDRARLDATGKQALVHDFAWTADPDFVVRKRPFYFDAWKERFPDEVEAVGKALGAQTNLRLRKVEVVVLVQPEHRDQELRHFEATSAALFFYGLWYGEYPYSQVTCVDPAWGGRQAGGMEYPTLFTAGTRMWTRPSMHSPEGVTVHECGHQFWYGLVGNNEFEASWMDEGFNTFTDSDVAKRVWGDQIATTDYSGVPLDGVAAVAAPGAGVLGAALAARSIPVPWVGFAFAPLRESGFVDWWRDQPALSFAPETTDPVWQDRARYIDDPDRDPIDTPAFRYVDSRSYRTNSYQRTAVVLGSLQAVVGREKFLAGMRHYSENWRYRHPYAEDFFAAFQQGAGVDVQWYFDELFRGTGTIDWRVAVEQRQPAREKGFFQEHPGAAFVAKAKAQAEAQDDTPPDDAVKADTAEEAEPKAASEAAPASKWRAEVLVTRHGELRLPLEIELRYEDQSSERRKWSREDQASSRWLKLVLEGDKKLIAVVLDPEGAYKLDLDMTNNRWFDATDHVAPWRWSERAFQRYASWLFWQAGIGG